MYKNLKNEENLEIVENIDNLYEKKYGLKKKPMGGGGKKRRFFEYVICGSSLSETQALKRTS